MSELQKAFYQLKKYIVVIVLFFILLLFIRFYPFITVNAGERGVLLNFGAVQERILDEGLHFIIPVMQQVKIIDVKIKKFETEAQASTKDLQNTIASIALNYRVDALKANKIYQNIGIDYELTVIDPSLQEVVKSVAAQYTAEELIKSREKVSIQIKKLLTSRLAKYFIIVNNFSIANFKFSETFSAAIEEKKTSEQKALKAQRDLERIKFEAKQSIEQAKAEAEALRLKGKEVSKNLIRLKEIEAKIKAIEKWDGKLPSVNSGAVPFIDVKDWKE